MTTIAARPAVELLTYEAYMAEPEVEGRYDIVNGVRISAPGNPFWHQRISGNVLEALRRYERMSGNGIVVPSPFDVLIRRVPQLQIRQPDLLFVSQSRLAQAGGPPKFGPLTVTPELVVEIVSTPNMGRILPEKLTDYAAIGVEEVWVIWALARELELLRLTPEGFRRVGKWNDTWAIMSFAFPKLMVPAYEIFAA